MARANRSLVAGTFSSSRFCTSARFATLLLSVFQNMAVLGSRVSLLPHNRCWRASVGMLLRGCCRVALAVVVAATLRWDPSICVPRGSSSGVCFIRFARIAESGSAPQRWRGVLRVSCCSFVSLFWTFRFRPCALRRCHVDGSLFSLCARFAYLGSGRKY